jgi:hypothetical protein
LAPAHKAIEREPDGLKFARTLAYYLRCIPNKIRALGQMVVYPENSSQADFVRAVAPTRAYLREARRTPCGISEES